MTFYNIRLVTIALIFSFASPALADESEIIVKLRDTIKKAFVKVEAIVFKKEDAPKPVIPVKCECNGTGYITHGDGHKTACPNYPDCTKGTGKVAPKVTIDVPKVQPKVEPAPVKLNAYIEMYSASWCAPCKQWKYQKTRDGLSVMDGLTKSGWTIQVWDVDSPKTPLDKRKKYSKVPTFEVYIDGNLDVVEGFLTPTKLNELKAKYNR
jgi:hypothetical protein